MDARLLATRALRVATISLAFCSLGASYRTTNFVISAPTPELAREIGDSAEAFRRDLAIQWLGEEIPQWNQPCPITAQVAPNLGAGGATSFVFDNGQVFGWKMVIQGSHERILDSVLPHEVTHTIFATHFRQPLPRWADEGACTTVEHVSEKERHKQMLISFLKNDRGISFSRMFRMTEYPSDVLPLYAQGFSLARFLIEQRGHRTYVDFIEEGLAGDGLREPQIRLEHWTRALENNYSIGNLHQLQNSWLAWVKQGSPRLQRIPAAAAAPEMIAASAPRPRAEPDSIYHQPRAKPATSPAPPRRELTPVASIPDRTPPLRPLLSRPQADLAVDRTQGWRPAGHVSSSDLRSSRPKAAAPREPRGSTPYQVVRPPEAKLPGTTVYR